MHSFMGQCFLPALGRLCSPAGVWGILGLGVLPSQLGTMLGWSSQYLMWIQPWWVQEHLGCVQTAAAAADHASFQEGFIRCSTALVWHWESKTLEGGLWVRLRLSPTAHRCLTLLLPLDGSV